MRSGQDADFWSIGYGMVEMPKKTLKLKQPLPPAKAKRGGRGKRPAAKARPEVKADGSARLAAFTVLKDILVNNMVSDAALAQNKMFAALERRDRAFARLLVTSCLRRCGQTQKIIDHCLSKPASDDITLILHLGLVQLLFLDTSPHAATNTSVELARTLKQDRATGLVNAVMRRAIREQDSLLGLTSVLDNLPAALKASWAAAYGPEQTAAIAELAMTTPPLDLTLKPDADQTKLAEALAGVHLQDHTLRCHFDGDIRQMPSYEDGLWWVQDAAAALCGTLAKAGPGKIIWDLCAAPGGKTAQLAAAGAEVTAVDADARRLDRLKANMNRLGLAAEVIEADILSAEFDRMATKARPDVILLDAPCSATGTIRRRPDILVRSKELELAELKSRQTEMLAAALRWVKSDGFVLYATCSLQPEEGEQVVTEVISKGLAMLDSFGSEELGLFSPALSTEGWVRILPTCLSGERLPPAKARTYSETGNDGFFIARLRPVTA